MKANLLILLLLVAAWLPPPEAAAQGSLPPEGGGAGLPEWINDPSVYMIALEALVVEVSDDKTRELSLHVGFVRNDLTDVVAGGDILLSRPFENVRVPTFSGNSATGITSTGFQNRLPGLGATLVGMDVNGAVLSARLRTLLDQGEAQITSRPVVLAVHGTQATIDVGSRVPYQDFAADGAPTVAEGTVGIKMVVTPTITDLANGRVELNITTIDVSTLSDILSVQNIDRPVFTSSSTRGVIPMNAGETFKFSSFKGKRKREVREGIPFLMRIPLLGRLFSNTSQVMEDVDVLFFITPHIIPPGQNVILPYDFTKGEELVGEHDVRLAEPDRMSN